MNIHDMMKKHTKYKVSKEASEEYESMIEAAMDTNMNIIDTMLESENRKIVRGEDVIKVFSFLDTTTIESLERTRLR